MRKNNFSLQDLFSQLKADGFLITNLTNIKYITGFNGSSAYILLTPKKKYFITDFRYKTQSLSQVSSQFNFIFYQSNLIPLLCKLLKQNRLKRLGIETDYMNYNFATLIKKETHCQLINCSEIILKQRSIKTEYEVNLLKKSLLIAEKSFSHVKQRIRPGAIEKDLEIELEYHIKKQGAQEKSFPIIVASGVRSALPHAQPTHKKLKGDECVIFDFGAKYWEYNSDITITTCMSLKNKKLLKAYHVVEESLEMARSMIKHGVSTRAVAKKVDRLIKQNGFSDGLIHSLGHGIGLEVHELPNMSTKKDDEFKENMVFTVEPGIYLPNIGGIRIEKTFFLSKMGLQLFNSIS